MRLARIVIPLLLTTTLVAAFPAGAATPVPDSCVGSWCSGAHLCTTKVCLPNTCSPWSQRYDVGPVGVEHGGCGAQVYVKGQPVLPGARDVGACTGASCNGYPACVDLPGTFFDFCLVEPQCWISLLCDEIRPDPVLP